MEEERKEEKKEEMQEKLQEETVQQDSVQGEKPKSKKKPVIIAIVVVIAALMAVVGTYAANKWGKIKKTDLKKENLEVSKEVEQKLAGGYLNVALFGVNMKSANDDAVDSDAIYVASINLDTKEIRLVAVYGNTILSTGGKKIRIKEAYADGGAEKAIAVLNENLDLDIQKYVSVNFKAMADMIDLLGGVEIDVAEEEVPHVDGYVRDMAAFLGEEDTKLEGPGKQTLNGLQAVGYCRIRVTDGGDVKRGGRQQMVVQQMFKKLEDAKFAQMDKIMDKIFPEVETNFKFDEAANYGKDVASYKFGSIQAFPSEIKPQTREGGIDGDYAETVECTDYEKDVIQLHKSLFDGVKYEASDNVKKIAETLK